MGFSSANFLEASRVYYVCARSSPEVPCPEAIYSLDMEDAGVTEEDIRVLKEGMEAFHAVRAEMYLAKATERIEKEKAVAKNETGAERDRGGRLTGDGRGRLTWAKLVAELRRQERKGNLAPGYLDAPYREATGEEVASQLEALLLEARDVWSEHAFLWTIETPRPLSKEEALAFDEGGRAWSLQRSALRVIKCTMEAARWLHRHAGPRATGNLLDEIAEHIETAWQVTEEILGIAEARRDPSHAEDVGAVNIIRYDDNGNRMSVGEIIAHDTQSCAELDGSLMGKLEKCHETVKKLREFAPAKESAGEAANAPTTSEKQVSAPEGEWVGPHSKAEIARRILGQDDARWRKVATMFPDEYVEQMRSHKRLFRFRIDHLDSPTGAKCRGQ